MCRLAMREEIYFGETNHLRDFDRKQVPALGRHLFN